MTDLRDEIRRLLETADPEACGCRGGPACCGWWVKRLTEALERATP